MFPLFPAETPSHPVASFDARSDSWGLLRKRTLGLHLHGWEPIRQGGGPTGREEENLISIRNKAFLQADPQKPREDLFMDGFVRDLLQPLKSVQEANYALDCRSARHISLYFILSFQLPMCTPTRIEREGGSADELPNRTEVMLNPA